MENRLVLGIDNSMDFLSIALCLENRLIEERHIWNKRAPSEILPVEALHMLSRNSYTIKDVNLVVVTLGPGSFTGIRVGLAFCKGLNAGGNIPLVGVPTLDALASSFPAMEGHYLCPLIDAKKGEVFTALYHAAGGALTRLTDYCAVKPSGVADIVRTPCICFGTGAGICAEQLAGMDGVRIVPEGFSRISGEVLIREGLEREASAEGPLLPIYSRKSEAEIKFNITIE